MSIRYKFGDRVPSDVLCKRLLQLSAAATKGPRSMEMEREFTMRIPAELDRDADLVLYAAAKRIEELEESRTATIAQKTCEWTEDEDDGSWDGSCGVKWCLNEGTPEDNNMHYCPECGGSLVLRSDEVNGDASKAE